jgi:putative NADH-flavin reductase
MGSRMRTSLLGFYLVCFLSLLMPMPASGDSGTEPLRILVYGATGNIGTHIVDEALERGHFMTAVSRNPASITRQHEHLVPVKGDLLDPVSIRELATGQDVIIVSVRGVIGKTKESRQALQYLAVENLVSVLREMGDDAPRLIHVGGAGTLEVKPGVLYADRLPRLFLPKSLEIEIDGQIRALEYLRSVDDVEWTFATPPKNFTNGKRTGKYRIGGDRLMKDKRGRSRISRADFAVALIDEAEAGKYLNKRFSVAY